LLIIDKIVPSKALFRANAAIEWLRIMAVEGAKEREGLFFKVLMVTVNTLIHKASKMSGIAYPWQVHKGHDA
jgi:hypothetical protein